MDDAEKIIRLREALMRLLSVTVDSASINGEVRKAWLKAERVIIDTDVRSIIGVGL